MRMPVAMDIALLIITTSGALLASFAGVIAERLNTGESWTEGRSRCNSCGTTLEALDLIPILTWVARKGRARCCGASVPYQYVLSELSLAVLFFASYTVVGATIALPFLLLSLFILTIIVLYDIRHTIVPMRLAGLFLFFSLSYGYLASEDLLMFLSRIFWALLVGSFFFFLYAISRGRWMGLGDAPIALSLALMVGSADALTGLLYSFWIGAGIGIIILVTTPKGHRMGIEVPFIPFLAAGFLLALFTPWSPLVLF